MYKIELLPSKSSEYLRIKSIFKEVIIEIKLFKSGFKHVLNHEVISSMNSKFSCE